MKNDASQFGEMGTAGLQDTAGVVSEFFGALGNLLVDVVVAKLQKPACSPMPVRAENGRPLAITNAVVVFGTIEIPGDVKTGHALKIDLFN